ncbi:VanW family protein [Actinomycetaceae bacterium L2_0104]
MAKDPTGSKDRGDEAREFLSEGDAKNDALSFGPPTEAVVAQGPEGSDAPGGNGQKPGERRTLADAVGLQSADIRSRSDSQTAAPDARTPAEPETTPIVSNTGQAADSTEALPAAIAAADSTADSGEQAGAEHSASAGAATTVMQDAPAAQTSAAGSAGNDIPEDSGELKNKKRRWPWITALVVVVLAGGYVGAGYYFADRVPAGTTVAGIELGGLDRPAAFEKMEAGMSDQLAAPVQVVATNEGEPVTINPADYSLGIDKEATLDSIVGFSLDPGRIWAHITGGNVVDPVLTYDEAQLSSLVENLAAESDTDPADASIAFEGTQATVTPGQPGSKLNVEEAQEVLSKQVLSLEQPIDLPVETEDPAITTETAEKALEEVAQPLVSGNVSVKVGESVAELTPEQLASAASFKADGNELVLEMDGGALNEAVRSAIPDVFTPGADARIEIVDHTTPTIVPSENGIGIDDAELAQKVADVASADDRTVELETTEVPAEFSTEDAEALGIKEVVSEITTPLTNDSVRTTNLEVGTQKITNTLVKPEETFSLSEALGPIDAEHGFVSSGVVANGFNSEAMGGGLSQLSTNTFNIGYLAGLTDVEHQPHSKYFDRYPMGREATLWEGTIDMRWKNNTPYGVVIDTWVADGQVHSQLWSTKYWDVETTTSDPYNYVAPTTKTNTAWDCVPSGAGGSGFTVTVSRTVSHDGVVNEADSGSYNWTYQPVHAVTCG